jgi:integrase
VNGVDLELSTLERPTDSDALECVGTGPWQHYVLTTCGSHEVPLVRLELRLASELLRDRPDRYEPLIHHMATHGFDKALLQRAMNACAIPAHRQKLIEDSLNPLGFRHG